VLTWDSLRKSRVRAALGEFAMLVAGPMAAVVGHFHVPATVAALIVAAIISGATAVLPLYPQIITVVETLRLVILPAGTGAAIGW
jgi:hypothetical protein